MITVPLLLLRPMGTQQPLGNAEIRGAAGDSEIVITTTSRLAGAIDSLTWNGVEFIDSVDHGRQLQSACSYGFPLAGDGGLRFVPETFNPTEAGCRFDGAGETSSSRLLSLSKNANELQTVTRMAYWLRPGDRSAGQLARNASPLSRTILLKTVRIGLPKLPHVIQYDVTFVVPPGLNQKLAQFEALTGYMPPTFSRFMTYAPTLRTLTPLGDGPGEQALPIIFANESGSHAMGIWSSEESPRYGRFRFDKEKVVKWNCVFRTREEQGVKAGTYSFRCYVVVGDLKTVQQSMTALAASLAK